MNEIALNEEGQRIIEIAPEKVVTGSYMPPKDEDTSVVVREITDPAQLLEEDTRIAKLLADVLRSQGLISDIQGKEYVRVEGWTLLASWKHVYPVCVWTRPLHVNGQDTPIMGFEARVEVRNANGLVVSAAEARCTRDEKNWKTRDEFALCSMAQTRATAKASRILLGYIVVLAGYEATPAEEMLSEATVGDLGSQLQASLDKIAEDRRMRIEADEEDQLRTLPPETRKILEMARANREKEQAKLDARGPIDRQKLAAAGLVDDPPPEVCEKCGATVGHFTHSKEGYPFTQCEAVRKDKTGKLYKEGGHHYRRGKK